MRYLEGNEAENAKIFMKEAVKIAKQATCQRRICGTVIVKDNKIIGKGWNSPPMNIETQRRCQNNKTNYHKKVTDKTCCIHAEQRAILDVLKNEPKKIEGSKLYFISINKERMPLFSSQPYCTICSKLALDVGIYEFILWHKEGLCAYTSEEYNNLSYKFIPQNKSPPNRTLPPF
jgi:deoxycytidylate deaminase